LVKAQYAAKKSIQTDVEVNKARLLPKRSGALQIMSVAKRTLHKSASGKIEVEYILPIEVHNPMELHAAVTVIWEGDDKVIILR